MEFDNTDRGTLFKNDRKEKDTHADYNGSINVGGTEFWLNAWIKTSKTGSKFMSLSVKPKDPKPMSKQAPNAPAVDMSTDGIDDDCPF